MKTIELSCGMRALVDDEDYDVLNQYKWCAMKNGKTFYARRRLGNHTQLMHRTILGAPQTMQVDHIDGDGLNNQKYNLRLATVAQNQHNSGLRNDNSSGFRGISKQGDKWWVSAIRIDGERHYLGCFRTREDAARAYDNAARLYHGEFAFTNFRSE